MPGIVAKVDASRIQIAPPPRTTSRKRTIIERPITSIDDLFTQEATIRRILQFQLVVAKIARMIGDSGIDYAEAMSEKERDTIWSISGVNNSTTGHEVYLNFISARFRLQYLIARGTRSPLPMSESIPFWNPF
jgi:hypothetical protein